MLRGAESSPGPLQLPVRRAAEAAVRLQPVPTVLHGSGQVVGRLSQRVDLVVVAGHRLAGVLGQSHLVPFPSRPLLGPATGPRVQIRSRTKARSAWVDSSSAWRASPSRSAA